MKKLSAIILWCLLAILSGCTTAQFDKHHSSDSSPEPKLSLEEAKAAFEETYSIALTKSGSGNGHRNKLSPGEFTPLWDNAAYSENPKACSYDVKLITERKVYAIVAEFRNGKSVAEKVQVHQRLVTIKNESYPRTCCYILSLIPDYGCDGGNRMEERFRCCSDKGLFSGLAVYSALGSNAILRIDRYRNGIRLDGVYIPAGNGSKERRLEKAASMLRGITLINRRSVTTKSFGEDFWDDDDEWDYGDPEDYTDIGGGFFEDEDGNKYFDTDGDGIPDSMVIEGGGIDGNDDGDDDEDNNGLDDSWWLWNPNPDDNGNEGYNPEEDPYYNTNDDFDGHTGDDNNEDDDDGDEELDKRPKRLSNYYGTREYYKKRVEDFLRRYPELSDKVPNYYMEYGDKYYRIFTEQVREKLSDPGKNWVDNTAVALQVKLDDILIENPDIEHSPDLLRELAFQSHVDAYLDSGLLDLDMHDKITITLSIDLVDLLNNEGISQVNAIIDKQIEHYWDNWNDAVTDARFFVENYQWIITELISYLNNNIGLTKTSATITEYELFDLLFGRLTKYYETNVPGFHLPQHN